MHSNYKTERMKWLVSYVVGLNFELKFCYLTPNYTLKHLIIYLCLWFEFSSPIYYLLMSKKSNTRSITCKSRSRHSNLIMIKSSSLKSLAFNLFAGMICAGWVLTRIQYLGLGDLLTQVWCQCLGMLSLLLFVTDSLYLSVFIV